MDASTSYVNATWSTRSCAPRGGEFDALMQLLDPDVVLLPDAAAVAMGSLRETRGAEAVAKVLSGGARARCSH